MTDNPSNPDTPDTSGRAQDPVASQLLRAATDDLPVDVDHLVRGGITRGRAARRRRRVGTSLAAAAVVGAVGVAASVGPGLLDRDGTRDVGLADQVGGLDGRLDGQDALDYVRDRYQGAPVDAEGRRALATSVDEVPETFASLFAGEITTDVESVAGDATAASFFWEGQRVRVGFVRSELVDGAPAGTPTSRCVLADPFRTGCRTLPDGSAVQTEGPSHNRVDGIVLSESAWAFTSDGWVVQVSVGEIGGEGGGLTEEQVLEAATSDVWFDADRVDVEPATPRTPRAEARRIAVSSEEVPAIVAEAFGGEAGAVVTTQGMEAVDEPDRVIVHFLYDDTLTTFVVERADTLASCAELVDPANQPDGRPGGECVERDGIEVLLAGPEVGDGVTSRSVLAWQQGFVVSLVSTDAADKDGPPVGSGTGLSTDELVDLATSPRWFVGS